MSQRDFYQVLGVARDASLPDIRAAFVRLAKHHHPDHARSAALPGRLHEIQQAYRCLSEAGARARHDDELAESERLHIARQRRVQDRLARYDGRHARPRSAPHPTARIAAHGAPRATPRSAPRATRRQGVSRGIRWRTVIMLVMSTAILASMSGLVR